MVQINKTLDEMNAEYQREIPQRVSKWLYVPERVIWRHIKFSYWMISIYDTAVVLERYEACANDYRSDFKIVESITCEISSHGQYLYLGMLCCDRSSNISSWAHELQYDFQEDTLIDRLKTSAAYYKCNYMVYRIHTKHIGGERYCFTNPHCGVSVEEGSRLDSKLYYSIADELKQLPAMEYYDYCMQIIGAEECLYDYHGNKISGGWTNMIEKTKEDFMDPSKVAKMFSSDHPILYDFD